VLSLGNAIHSVRLKVADIVFQVIFPIWDFATVKTFISMRLLTFELS
jgi:hypothetical protein